MGSTDDLRKIGHCDVAGLQKKMSYDVVSGRTTEIILEYKTYISKVVVVCKFKRVYTGIGCLGDNIQMLDSGCSGDTRIVIP
ncbi:hypothetical protein DPMN_181693 [Dreissena polymorpha]|uniref:Uncharacterized protein n=1 Tax=Dreissena polymorpha TaxID=45954 RepID=A0A9D4DEX7_DREPO|nr:hypothetical protein DPMN_181693 [Dreissena polymorpha]